MSSIFTRLAAALTPTALAERVPASAPATLASQLSTVYALAQTSDYVFGSPLGPFYAQTRHYHVPRFVYFGPHTSDESLRLAFYAGFDATDLRGTHALLGFVERLAQDPEIGAGLNLSFFPLVDALGVFQSVRGRQLDGEVWSSSTAPELGLLEKDARLRGYHGFVRIESAPAEDDVISVRVRAAANSIEPTGVEFITSDDFDPLPVRFEADPAGATPVGGPLSIAEDLPFAPFELTLRLPLAWQESLHRAAVYTILKRFIRRYRALHAYGQHL